MFEVGNGGERAVARRTARIWAFGAATGIAGAALVAMDPVAAYGAEPGSSVPQAQIAQQAVGRTFAVPAQPLASAMVLFGRQAGLQVSYPSTMVAGLSSPGVTGDFPPDEALRRLLAGTGLTYRFTNATTVTLEKTGGAAAPAQLPAVTVEDFQQLDIGRTEGTASYAGNTSTLGSKSPATIRETPQSVSVVTRQRLEDQNLTTVEDAMKQTTGMTVLQTDAARSNIYSRGYSMSTMQVDGMTSSWNNFFATAPDLALYDRVEVMRGPSGLFQGSGEPSGVINLVRKRPLDHFAYGGAATVGSWDAYRGEADISAPLLESGRARVRGVAAYEDKDSFIDVVESEKKTFYGTAEFDLAEKTTLSVGATRQSIDYVPFFGLPAYANGQQVDVPRSTFAGADWQWWDTDTTDFFAELEHKLDNGGYVKLSGRYIEKASDAKYTSPNGAVNPVTGNFGLNVIRWASDGENTVLDGHVNTPFRLGEQTHQFVVGADYRFWDYLQSSGTGTAMTQNIFDPNHALPEQNINYAFRTNSIEEQYGTYSQARLKLADPLTAIVGGRVSWWETKTKNPTTGAQAAGANVSAEVTPYAGLIMDINENVSVYGSYANIFQPQTALTVDGEILPPRIGDQFEFGLKTELFDKNLIGHVAFFNVRDENRAMTDPLNPTFSIAAGEVQSRGFEAEVSGKPLPNWDVFAGYAYTRTKYLTGTTTQTGQPFSTATPAHTLNLWTKYSFDDGMLDRFSIGGGLKFVSSFYTQSGAVRFEEDGYAVASAMLGYKVTDDVSLSLSVNNLFDENYFQWVNSAANGNRYGEPRSVWLTLRKTL